MCSFWNQNRDNLSTWMLVIHLIKIGFVYFLGLTLSIPNIITWRPWKDRRHGSKQVSKRPCDHHVVVDADEEWYEKHCVSDSCGKIILTFNFLEHFRYFESSLSSRSIILFIYFVVITLEDRSDFPNAYGTWIFPMNFLKINSKVVIVNWHVTFAGILPER